MKLDPYWLEAIQQSAGEHGVAMTSKQSEAIASDIQGAHEVYGESTGLSCIPHPDSTELTCLRKSLETERSLITCPNCRGEGRVTHPTGASHFSNTECWMCNGRGSKLP